MALLPANDEDFIMETRDTSPAHLLVKIKSFPLLSEHQIWTFKSREFVAGDYKWRLIIYPDGDESVTESDHVSVYVSVVGTSSLPVDWEVNAMFTVFLFNQILDKYHCFRGKVDRRFHAMNPKWGFSKLISKKSLMDPSNGYLVDDKCVFGAEVFVIKSKRVVEFVSVMQVTDPYKHDWMISNFSKLEGVWTSEELRAGGYRWKIKLYPNGNGSGEGRSLSIYMVCVDSENFAPHNRVRADICVRIKNKLHDNHHSENFSHWFTSSEPNSGISDFIPLLDMRDPSKGFVVDDCCFLETEISLQALARDQWLSHVHDQAPPKPTSFIF